MKRDDDMSKKKLPVTNHQSPVTILKVMTILGTRPEIIRLSRTMTLLDKYVNHVIVYTGQNYDYELNEIFWNELELRKPDYTFNIDTKSLGSAIGDIIQKSEEVLRQEKPDAVLVLGDTNSCLAAYMAKRMHIPVFHMEAGNRCFDENVPEETNRRIIDHIADFNLVYTEHARRHLLSEGLPHRRIYLTGSPMKEVLDYYRPKIDQSDILTRLNLCSSHTPQTSHQSQNTNHQSPVTNHYFLVSVHREENVDNPENLQKILVILNLLAGEYKLPVIISTHPRTREKLKTNHQSSVTNNKLIKFLKPFGYFNYVKLQTNALCTISDSGTISEESAILAFPAITLRNSMERPEAQDTGAIILSGLDSDIVLQSVRLAIEEHKNKKHSSIPTEYQVTDTSSRVVKLILGNTRLSNLWNGIKSQC